MRSNLSSIPATKTSDAECGIQVEGAGLHAAAIVATDPGRTAPAAAHAEIGEHTMAGHRWGHGLDSVMQQMAAATQRRSRRDFGSS